METRSYKRYLDIILNNKRQEDTILTFKLRWSGTKKIFFYSDKIKFNCRREIVTSCT